VGGETFFFHKLQVFKHNLKSAPDAGSVIIGNPFLGGVVGKFKTSFSARLGFLRSAKNKEKKLKAWQLVNMYEEGYSCYIHHIPIRSPSTGLKNNFKLLS
jgi:hypothetical protein